MEVLVMNSVGDSISVDGVLRVGERGGFAGVHKKRGNLYKYF